MSWLRACKISDLNEGEILRLDLTPPVAVYHVDGEFFATDDTCTHAESSLSDGYLEGNEVECVWHYARFCVKSGKALGLPATKDLQTYPTKVEDDEVLVDLSARTPPSAQPS